MHFILCNVFNASSMNFLLCMFLYALLLCNSFYVLYTLHCILCIVYFPLYSMHCVLCIPCKALYSMHCILWIVYYTQHSIWAIILTLKLVADHPINRPTDQQQTDRMMDIVTYRAAITAKNGIILALTISTYKSLRIFLHSNCWAGSKSLP